MNGNNDCTTEDFSRMKFRFMATMAMFTLCSWTVYFVAITFFPIPKENLPLVNTIVGFLILELGIMIGYYFGASQSSSAHKDRDNPNLPGTVVSGTSTSDVHTESVITKPTAEEVKVVEIKTDAPLPGSEGKG